MSGNDENLALVFKFQKYKITGTVAFKNGDPIGVGRPPFLINFKDHDKELSPIQFGIDKLDGINFEREVGFNEKFLTNTNYEVYLTLGKDKETVRNKNFLRIVGNPIVGLTSKGVIEDSFTLESSIAVPPELNGKIEQPKILGQLHFYNDNHDIIHSEEIETKRESDIKCTHTFTKKFSDIPELETLPSFKVAAEIGGILSPRITINHEVTVKVIELRTGSESSDYIKIPHNIFVNKETPVTIDWGDGSNQPYDHTDINKNGHHYTDWGKEGNYPVIKLNIHNNAPVLDIGAFLGQPNFWLTGISIQDGINIDNATNLFRGQRYLVDVGLPKDCKKIPDWAFTGCEKLGDIRIPDSVTTLGSDVFEGAKVKSLTLPKNLKGIGKKCFYDMTIPKISIPENVSTIDHEVFLNSHREKLIGEVEFNWIHSSNVLPYNDFDGVTTACDPDGTVISIPDGQAGETSEQIRQYYIDKGYKCPVQSYYVRVSVTSKPRTEEPNAPEIHGLTYNTTNKDKMKYINVELVEKSGDNWIPTGKGEVGNVIVTVTNESGATFERDLSIKEGRGSVDIISDNTGTRTITVAGERFKQVNTCSIEDCWMYIEANNNNISEWDRHGATDHECYIKDENGFINISRPRTDKEDSGVVVGIGDIHYPHFEAKAKIRFHSPLANFGGRQLFAVRNETPDMKSGDGSLILDNEANALYAGNFSKEKGACAGGIISNNSKLVYNNQQLMDNTWYEMTLKYTETGEYQCIVKETETDKEIIKEVKPKSDFKKVPNVLSFIITSEVNIVEIEKIVVKNTSTPQNHAATLLTVGVNDLKSEYHVGDNISVDGKLQYYDTKTTNVGIAQGLIGGHVTLYQVTDKYGNQNPIKITENTTTTEGQFEIIGQLKETSNDCLALKAVFEGTVDDKKIKYQPTYEVYYNKDSKVLPKGAPFINDLTLYNDPDRQEKIEARIGEKTVQGSTPILYKVWNPTGEKEELQHIKTYNKIGTYADYLTLDIYNKELEDGAEYVITFRKDDGDESVKTNKFKVYKGVKLENFKETIDQNKN